MEAKPFSAMYLQAAIGGVIVYKYFIPALLSKKTDATFLPLTKMSRVRQMSRFPIVYE